MFNPRNARQMGLAITVISELTVVVCVGGGAGFWLDSALGSSPSFTLSFSILALVYGFKRLVTTLNQASKKHDDEPPDSGPH
jgi:ATP synthase protein I|tara:strand:- start:5 stop:250 length:246 start_codon:yes stop_codon:yes gene_type:complete